VVFTSKSAESKANIEYRQIVFDGSEIEQMLKILHEKNLLSVIVEGGRALLQSFIDKSLWDEAYVFIGGRFFGEGVRAPVLNGSPQWMYNVEDSSLCLYRNPLSQ
jgi:diaminohydroxyphosphoribosylaminopyrimidine deaminase/5-amino-6-(5-phosphoribosylamino)uracil reductase